MEQKTIQINIEDDNGIQSFVVYRVRYKIRNNDKWYSWLSYLNRKNASRAVDNLESLPYVKFACIDKDYVFI